MEYIDLHRSCLYLDRCLISCSEGTVMSLQPARRLESIIRTQVLLAIPPRGSLTFDLFLESTGRAMALTWNTRRSPVVCRHGCVACSQPLAAEVGLSILKKGGNAADAAVAVAAALNVTEPYSTGIGGDCFCLFYDATTKSVRGLNGR